MRRNRLRVAVIGTRGIPGAYSGVERVAEHLYPLLAERGHDITVYCRTTPSERGSASYRGVRRVSLPAPRLRSLETLSHSLLSTSHALLSGRFDLIQLEALAAGLFSGAGRLHSIPTVVRVHGLDWQRAKWGALAARVLRAGEITAVRHAAEIIVVSRELQRYFADTYGRPVVHIPNGVAADESAALDGDDVVAAFGLEPGRYFAFIGRLVPEKRVEDLLLAFQRIDAPVRLAIVGESSYTDAYVSRLRALAANDARIVFTGFQQGTALDALRSGAAAFVSPSELEGLPMAVLECLERGVPAILSDIGPHRELLDAVSGYDLFHTVGDVDALAACMRRILDEPLRQRAVAEAARAHVQRAFSWSAIAERTEETFLAAVEAHRYSQTARRRPQAITVTKAA